MKSVPIFTCIFFRANNNRGYFLERSKDNDFVKSPIQTIENNLKKNKFDQHKIEIIFEYCIIFYKYILYEMFSDNLYR